MNAAAPTADDNAIETFIQQGWADHVDHTEAVAQRLAQRSAADVPAGQLQRFVGLLVHVFGEHLGRCDEGIGLLRAMAARPSQKQVNGVLPRGMAALGLAAGNDDAASALSVEARLAARATAASILNGQRQTSAAMAMLRAALSECQTLQLPDTSPAIRALAVAGNNIAADLQDLPQRSAEQDEAMLLAGQVGLDFWRRCGGWLEHERAEYRVARGLLRAGRAAEGLAHARACLAICQANEAPPFEHFFGHALAATCAAAAGDDAAFIEHNEQALIAWAKVSPDELSWCQDELAELREAGKSLQGHKDSGP